MDLTNGFRLTGLAQVTDLQVGEKKLKLVDWSRLDLANKDALGLLRNGQSLIFFGGGWAGPLTVALLFGEPRRQGLLETELNRWRPGVRVRWGVGPFLRRRGARGRNGAVARAPRQDLRGSRYKPICEQMLAPLYLAARAHKRCAGRGDVV